MLVQPDQHYKPLAINDKDASLTMFDKLGGSHGTA